VINYRVDDQAEIGKENGSEVAWQGSGTGTGGGEEDTYSWRGLDGA
jgi:hypothetical protein